MTELLVEPNPGDRIGADLIRKIIRAVRSCRLIMGPGINLSYGPNGTTVSVSETQQTKREHPMPWTFECKIDKNGNRTGGWVNAQIQFGLSCYCFGDYRTTYPHPVGSYSDGFPVATSVGTISITGCTETGDGSYYLEVKPGTRKAALKRYGAGDTAPQDDIENDKYYIYIGRVKDGIQTDGIFTVPVIYKYL